jgi:hypothetical protein
MIAGNKLGKLLILIIAIVSITCLIGYPLFSNSVDMYIRSGDISIHYIPKEGDYYLKVEDSYNSENQNPPQPIWTEKQINAQCDNSQIYPETKLWEVSQTVFGKNFHFIKDQKIGYAWKDQILHLFEQRQNESKIISLDTSLDSKVANYFKNNEHSFYKKISIFNLKAGVEEKISIFNNSININYSLKTNIPNNCSLVMLTPILKGFSEVEYPLNTKFEIILHNPENTKTESIEYSLIRPFVTNTYNSNDTSKIYFEPTQILKPSENIITNQLKNKNLHIDINSSAKNTIIDFSSGWVYYYFSGSENMNITLTTNSSPIVSL